MALDSRIACLAAVLMLSSFQEAGAPGGEGKGTELIADVVAGELPPLILPGQPYATPLAGQGFWTTLFGDRFEVHPSDRRTVSSWIGGVAWTPYIEDLEVLPFGALYLWRRMDEDHFFRATLLGVVNDVFYAHSPSGWGDFETVVTFENYTLPFDQAEYIDGERDDAGELNWGTARVGLGLGYRRQIAPGANDSMFAASLLLEPGYFYADDGSETAAGYVVPEDTFEGRAHFRIRLDAFERNLLELPHEGFAVGLDAIYGYRENWEDWGRNGREDGDDGRDYGLVSAYGSLVTGVPGVDSDRHRLLTTVYGGIGEDLDRFSAVRLGGGPIGDEYHSLARPVVPGSLFREFFPEHYATGIFEYRFEPAFFGYVGVVGSLTWLERERLRSFGIREEDDLLGSIGLRLSTGFLGGSRLQIEYHYNTGVIRDDEYGGHTLVLQVAGKL